MFFFLDFFYLQDKIKKKTKLLQQLTTKSK